ncbi:MAG: tetratricopeptide repeat protein [Hyphomonadaceae bacterium]
MGRKGFRRRVIGLAVLAVTSGASFAAPPFQDALNAYESGDYAAAYESFLSMAQQGDMDAALKVAIMSGNGQGAEASAIRSAYWFRKAAEAGVAEAQYSLGDMYRVGDGVAQSDEDAFEWTRKAAEQGHAKAQNALALFYITGAGTSRNDVKAREWFERAALRGHGGAAMNAAAMHVSGQGTPESLEAAERYFRLAAMAGEARGKEALASLGAPPIRRFVADKVAEEAFASGNYAAALARWQDSARQGDPSAENGLGALYFAGKGVPQSDEEAFAWFTRAADDLSPAGATARFNLAYMHLENRAPNPSNDRALELIQQAAELGHPGAQLQLGGLYAEGQGIEASPAASVYWFRQAAREGYPGAQNALGYAYAKGEGVERDMYAAFDWFKHSAEQGNPYAQSSLGAFHEEGWGGASKSYEEAMRYYRMAADQGRAYDQWRVGYLYYYGKGAPQDYDEAFSWFMRAAEQGDAQAQFEIGAMYEEGFSAEADEAEALRWYEASAAQGNAWGRWGVRHIGAVTRKRQAERNFEALAAFSEDLLQGRIQQYNSPSSNSYGYNSSARSSSSGASYSDPFGGLNPWSSEYQTNRCISSPVSCYQNSY